MSRSVPHTSSDRPLGGRYKIISQLGVGGFGRTFLAEDLHLPGHPQCVVKQLKPQVRSDDTLQMARRCFNTEAQVLYQLGNHDQIPRLLAHFEDNQEFYLAQEFVEGEPLTKELIEGKPWSEARVVLLIKDILNVLTFVHQRQVIHRDLKPSNLIRRRHDRRIVVIDFGAVKQVGTQNFDVETGLTNLTISIGTQGYMPNEQLAGKPRFSSDIYAVGIIGIQALTGIHPRHLGEDTVGEVEWHGRVPEISQELAAVLDRMVRYDFRERYPTAIEALTALSDVPVDTTDLALLFPPIAEFEKPLEPGLNTTTPPSPVSNGSAVPYAEFSAVDMTLSDDEPLPTAIWLPTESLPSGEQTGSRTAGKTGATQMVGRLNVTESEPAFPEPTAKRSRLPVMALAVIGAIGIAALAFTQTGGLPWLTSQTPEPSPSLTPAPSTPSPTLTPKQQAANLLAQASQLQQQGNYADALKKYDQAIGLQSNDAAAYAGRCETLNQLKRPEEAIVSCNDALAYQPNYPEALWSMGNSLLLQGHTYEALKRYEDVTYYKPGFADGWVKQGVALQALGRSAEALSALNQGIAIQRNSFEAWITKGAALINLQRYDEAVVALDKALQLQPNNAEAKKLRQQAKAKS